MDVDGFWMLIEASARDSVTRDDRESFLRYRLSRVARSHLLDFVAHLSATREPANTFRLWRACGVPPQGSGAGLGRCRAAGLVAWWFKRSR
jgi:hypothetical protein